MKLLNKPSKVWTVVSLNSNSKKRTPLNPDGWRERTSNSYKGLTEITSKWSQGGPSFANQVSRAKVYSFSNELTPCRVLREKLQKKQKKAELTKIKRPAELRCDVRSRYEKVDETIRPKV